MFLIKKNMINKLETSNKFTPTRETISLILEDYGIKVFKFTLITTGIANTTIVISARRKKYILRVYAQHRKKNTEILFEINFQNYLRINGTPVPEVYLNKNGKYVTRLKTGKLYWQSLLMDFVPGTNNTKHTPRLIKDLAIIQARMHILGTRFKSKIKRKEKSWKKLEDYYAVYVKNYSKCSIQEKEFIFRAKKFAYEINVKLPFGYNHLDLDLDGNVIVENNRIRGVVDFDDLSYSPVVVCFGYSLWNVLHDEGIIGMNLYRKHYEAVRPLGKNEVSVLPHVILFRNYEIGALRFYKTGDPSCLARPLEIEREVKRMINKL